MATHASSTPAPVVQPELLPAIGAVTTGIKNTLDRMCGQATDAVLGALALHTEASLLCPTVGQLPAPRALAPHGGAMVTAPKVGDKSANADLRSAKVAVVDLETPLPPHVPLPSLTDAFSRRRAIFGAVSATGLLRGLVALPLIGGATTITSDPVFAAIEKHRAAQEAFEASFDESARMVDIEDRQSAAGAVECEARHDMHAAVPTTLAGLAAYVAYWEALVDPPGLRFTQLEEIGWKAIPTIAEALEHLLQAGGARG